MVNIYENIDKYSLNKKHKILIVDMFSKRPLQPVVTELFSTSRKTNIFPLCLLSCFFVPKKCAILYILLYYENSKRVGASTNWNQSFI